MKRTLLSLSAAVILAGMGMGVWNADADSKKHQQMKNPNMAVWFEIPVLDMNRAVAFYNKLFNLNLKVEQKSGYPMAFFPATGNYGAAGALLKMEEAVPGPTGPVVYLNGGDDLQVVLDRVEGAGGRVIVKKTLISEEIGYFAIFVDTEGNRLGLFSAK
jgi:predicted enzyme related to lactoylglutathione lyase